MAIVRYTQVDAIYEAMRELEAVELYDEDGGRIYTGADISQCFAKIRSALAGETPEESDDPMVRPEDVAPPIAERSDEDSKTTWQG